MLFADIDIIEEQLDLDITDYKSSELTPMKYVYWDKRNKNWFTNINNKKLLYNLKKKHVKVLLQK